MQNMQCDTAQCNMRRDRAPCNIPKQHNNAFYMQHSVARIVYTLGEHHVQYKILWPAGKHAGRKHVQHNTGVRVYVPCK